MTEIPLIVTLNNQFTLHYLNNRSVGRMSMQKLTLKDFVTFAESCFIIMISDS